MKNTIKYDLEKYKTELCAQYEKIEFAQFVTEYFLKKC